LRRIRNNQAQKAGGKKSGSLSNKEQPGFAKLGC
jgi:hypothetical protein